MKSEAGFKNRGGKCVEARRHRAHLNANFAEFVLNIVMHTVVCNIGQMDQQ